MEHNMELKHKIESILFFKGQPVSFIELSKLLEVSIEDVKKSLQELSDDHQKKGTRITYNDHECEYVTASETSDILSKLIKQEDESELSNAALETLSIVLYMGPITRSMIDFVRGVNSQFTVRNLLVRGLIEKDPTSKNSSYIASLDTIKFLGLNRVTDIPNYVEVKHSISQFIKDNSNESEK